MKMIQYQKYTSGCVPRIMADSTMNVAADGVCVLKNRALNRNESIVPMDRFFAYIYPGSHDKMNMGAVTINSQITVKPAAKAITAAEGNIR